jgi:hypothetical protein
MAPGARSIDFAAAAPFPSFAELVKIVPLPSSFNFQNLALIAPAAKAGSGGHWHWLLCSRVLVNELFPQPPGIFSPHFGQRSLSYEAWLGEESGAPLATSSGRKQVHSESPNNKDVTAPKRPDEPMRLPQIGQVNFVLLSPAGSVTAILIQSLCQIHLYSNFLPAPTHFCSSDSWVGRVVP